MLKTIDILLGITVVMLIASMAVTVLTGVITELLNTRGKHLSRGLGDLLQQIDPKLKREIADQISHAVLTHPMISNGQQRPGNTIHREEFTKLLMDMAAGDSPQHLPENIKPVLMELLEKNGISDPATTLDNVRAYALQLELANPELATNVRHSIALMQEANSRLVAKINSWFDQTIDRVSDRFTASTRVITVVCSIIVVAGIQLDTIDVINRLSMDEGLRNALVTKAFALNQGQIENTIPTAAGKNNEMQATDQPKIQQQNFDMATVKFELKALQDLGVVNVLENNANWRNHWREINPFGIILSVFLLSLGAPFWYGALKNLLKLRGVIARKDDDERHVRQTTQTGSGASSAED